MPTSLGGEDGGLRQCLLEGGEGLLALWRPGEVPVLLQQLVQGSSCAGETLHKLPVI